MKSKLAYIHGWIINPILNWIPLYWLNIWKDNMTYAANVLGHPLFVFVWAFSSASGCYVYSKKIWTKSFFPYQAWIHALLCGSMMITPLIPYSLTLPVWINDLHVWLGILCVSGFIMEWMYWFILFGVRSLWDRIYLFSLVFSVALAFLPGSITAASQLSFSFFTNLLLSMHIKKED